MRSLRGLDFFGLKSEGEDGAFKGLMGLVGVEGSTMPKNQQRKNQRTRINGLCFKGSCLHQGKIRCRGWETVFCKCHCLKGVWEEAVVGEKENVVLQLQEEEEEEASDP